MKNLLITLMLMLTSYSILTFSQVPNSGFEQWTNGTPDGWYSFLTNVTQTTDAHSGSYALRGETIKNNNIIVAAITISGLPGQKGFPISKRYYSVSGYYKINSVLGDKFSVLAVIYGNGKALGFNASFFPISTTYTKFVLPFLYNTLTDAPDSCQITFSSGSDSIKFHEGTVFYVDDITLDENATSVDDISIINDFKLNQNYPNPFNPSTKISWQVPKDGFQSLKVYDILGNEIANLVNEYRPAGEYEVEFNSSTGIKNLPSGIYFYQLKAGSFIQTKKMILTK